MLTGYFLASLNATLNASAFVLMLLGYRAIKARRIEQHRKWMLAAFTASCLFLTSYLTRIALFGDTHFQGQGAVRYVYFAILISHVLLAIAVAPMVIATLGRGLKRQDDKHRALARKTFPIWAYVSVTGVVVYLMLYQLY
jgi:uncharacterized membrane protein YozB (DUF420 family)